MDPTQGKFSDKCIRMSVVSWCSLFWVLGISLLGCLNNTGLSWSILYHGVPRNVVCSGKTWVHTLPLVTFPSMLGTCSSLRWPGGCGHTPGLGQIANDFLLDATCSWDPSLSFSPAATLRSPCCAVITAPPGSQLQATCASAIPVPFLTGPDQGLHPLALTFLLSGRRVPSPRLLHPT